MLLLWRNCSKATWKAGSNALANVTWFISFKRTLQFPFFHSFHFNLSDASFSVFKRLLTSVIHSALQQVPVGQEFLCLASLKICSWQLPRPLTVYLFLFISNTLQFWILIKQEKWDQWPYVFFSWACSIIVCQVCRKFAVLTEAVVLFHQIERKRGRERFILEPKGRAVNQNHHPRS